MNNYHLHYAPFCRRMFIIRRLASVIGQYAMSLLPRHGISLMWSLAVATVFALPAAVFAVVCDVLQWPVLLTHYRAVRLLGDRNIVMYCPLSHEHFPDGPIRLNGNDW